MGPNEKLVPNTFCLGYGPATPKQTNPILFWVILSMKGSHYLHKGL